MRGATLFSGGGGVEARLKDHIDFVYAVEYDPAIAAVYRQNHGDHVQVARVEDVDYSLWGALDYLHASPVCKSFSQAKTGGVELESDIQSARAVVRCLEQTTPRVFTLENVTAYRDSRAYRLICQALDQAGYMWHASVLNSADYGVPQTRRRLILRAVKDALLPGLPAPLKWIGWYAATKAIRLEEKPIPPWANEIAQAARKMSSRFLIGTDTGFGKGFVCDDQPAMTIRSSNRGKMTIVIDGKSYKPSGEWYRQITTLPPSYQLPSGITLACTIIGNMAPSLLMREIVRPLL